MNVCDAFIFIIILNYLFQLRNIITNIGVRMTIDAFDQIYDRAASIHPRGLVSVEGFRNILDLMQADALLA